MIQEDPTTRTHEERGVLVIDETGERKDGTHTDHVGYQYLGSIGRIANGIVSVSSVWADGRIYHPLDVEPYTPAKRLKKGRSDPAFRTKPQIAEELVKHARAASIPFRAVVAECLYGENADFEGTMFKAKVPYVLSLRPHNRGGGPKRKQRTPRKKPPRGWAGTPRRIREGGSPSSGPSRMVIERDGGR